MKEKKDPIFLENGVRVYYIDEIKQNIYVEPSVFGVSEQSKALRSYLSQVQFQTPYVVADIGSGSGVLSYILASKNVSKLYATDINPESVKTINNNIERLNLNDLITPVLVDERDDVFHFLESEKLDLVVCNPPWNNAKTSQLEMKAIFDCDHIFLKKILRELSIVLSPKGEAIISLGDRSSINVMLKEMENLNLQYKMIIKRVNFSKFGIKPYIIFSIKHI